MREGVSKIVLQRAGGAHLISPGVEVHHQVLGLGVPVPNLALVTVGVPGHLLGQVPVVLVLQQKFILIILHLRSCFQGLAQHLEWQVTGGR